LTDRVTDLIESWSRRKEERLEKRNRLLVNTLLAVLAGIGISGVLAMVQDGFAVTGWGSASLVALVLVVAAAVGVVSYRSEVGRRERRRSGRVGQRAAGPGDRRGASGRGRRRAAADLRRSPRPELPGLGARRPLLVAGRRGARARARRLRGRRRQTGGRGGDRGAGPGCPAAQVPGGGPRPAGDRRGVTAARQRPRGGAWRRHAVAAGRGRAAGPARRVGAARRPGGAGAVLRAPRRAGARPPVRAGPDPRGRRAGPGDAAARPPRRAGRAARGWRGGRRPAGRGRGRGAGRDRAGRPVADGPAACRPAARGRGTARVRLAHGRRVGRALVTAGRRGGHLLPCLDSATGSIVDSH